MVPFILLLLVLLVHARSFLPFFADDAFISLRYARRLIDGFGLTWSDGPAVEGYSNLLWVLLAAALGRLGLDLVAAVRMLGLAGTAAAALAIVRIGPGRTRSERWTAVLPALAFVLCAPVGAWSIGGLEQPLVAALLAWSVSLVLPMLDAERLSLSSSVAPALLLGLLAITRPDGPIFTAALLAGVVVARGPRKADMGPLAVLAAGTLVLEAVQLGFRRRYYGDWLPNPAYAKLGWSVLRGREGAAYVGAGALWLLPVVTAAVATALATRKVPQARRRLILVAVPMLAWASYLVVIGGDLFPARRHLVPIVVLLSVWLAAALAELAARLGARRVAWAAAVVLAALVVLQGTDPESRRARDERWEWNGEVIGKLLHRAFGDRRALLAVDPAGCVPYFSGLPSVDMLGLNDRYLAHHPPRPIGHGRLGHELGDGAYVLARQPDLVIFCGPEGSERPCFPSGRQMALDPRFADSYRAATFEGTDPHPFRSRIWVRQEGGRIGIVRAAGQVIVPGWILSSNPASIMKLDARGSLGVQATAASPAIRTSLPLGAGRWTVLADTVAPPLNMVVLDSERHEVLVRGRDRVSFTLPGPGRVTLGLAPDDGTDVIVRRVVLERHRLPPFPATHP